MREVKWALSPEDIEWTMDWSKGKGNTRRTDGKNPNEPEQIFEEEGALSHLLMNDVIFLNNHWWEETWPEKAKSLVSLNVNCNDVFAWGCADGEEVTYNELKDLYQMWKKDPSWGAVIWCLIKRKEMPQGPVEECIRELGVWDLDDLKREHGLRANYYDGVHRVLAKRKYDTYSAWCAAENKEALPFEKGWWAGWKEYETAHPGWNDEAWQAEDDQLIAKWVSENGYGNS